MSYTAASYQGTVQTYSLSSLLRAVMPMVFYFTVIFSKFGLVGSRICARRDLISTRRFLV